MWSQLCRKYHSSLLAFSVPCGFSAVCQAYLIIQVMYSVTDEYLPSFIARNLIIIINNSNCESI